MLGQNDRVRDAVCTQQVGDVVRVVQLVAVFFDCGGNVFDEPPRGGCEVVGLVGVRVEVDRAAWPQRALSSRSARGLASSASSALKKLPMRRMQPPVECAVPAFRRHIHARLRILIEYDADLDVGDAFAHERGSSARMTPFSSLA